MKNDGDGSKGSSDNFLSTKGCPESYSPNAGSVEEDLSPKGRPHKKIKPNDHVNLHIAKQSRENQINLGEENMEYEARDADSSSLELIKPKLIPRPVEASAPIPSFDRIPAPSSKIQASTPIPVFVGIPAPSSEIQLRPRITNKSVPGQNVVLVRPRIRTGQTSHRDHRIRQEGDEEIPEEEAVCKFCFNKLREENMVVKTMCGCKKALALEECASNWSREKGNSNCDLCGQEVKKLPVTLLLNSSEGIDNQGNDRNRNLLQRLMRFLRCGSSCWNR